MNKKLRELLLKLFSLTLAIILSLPVQIFAQGIDDNNKKYRATSSIMGLTNTDISSPKDQIGDESLYTTINSDISTDNDEHFTIDKSAQLSKATNQVRFKIQVASNIAGTDTSNEVILANFALSKNSNLSNLKVQKVTQISSDGQESESTYQQSRPNIFSTNPNIDTLAITAKASENQLVYYLIADLTDDAILSLTEEKDLDFALDMVISQGDDIYQDRYSLALEYPTNNANITLDQNGNIIEEQASLVEVTDYDQVVGEYIPGQKNIFQSSPAKIVWTDYITSTNGKEITLDFNLDQNQITNNAQIKIEFFEARENGFILNNSFSQNLPYTNAIKVQIPEGQIARVELTTAIDPDTNAKSYRLNQTEITNPDYKEEEANSDQSAADTDSLANNSLKSDAGTNSSNDTIAEEKDLDFSKNPKAKEESKPADDSLKSDAGQNSSNDIIAEQNDLDFSANSTDKKESPTTHTLSKDETGSNSSNDIIANNDDQTFSAISLNKDSLISTLSDNNALTDDNKQAIILYTNSLEAYNDGQITKEELISELKATSADNNLSKDEAQDILEALVAGLDKDIHKVASLDPAELTNDIYPLDRQKVEPQVAGPDAKLPAKTPDQLAKEKLAEEGVTIEDFQNYMYELEEKYNLTDEDADRIYTENAKAIQALVAKAQEEKTTGDVFAVTSAFANKTFRLTTNMNVLAMPLWSIPAGWYFDINVGPYLYLDGEAKDLYDGSKKVATAQYYPGTNTIRYTFTEPVLNTTSIPINQDFKFNTEAIGDKNPIDIKINVKPKNNPAQSQTYRVDANIKQSVYESKVVLAKYDYQEYTGTHVSLDAGNHIRYSYVPKKPTMNSYELAYTDPDTGEVNYFVLLRPENIKDSLASSKVSISLNNNGSTAKLGTALTYTISASELDSIKQAFIDRTLNSKLSTRSGQSIHTTNNTLNASLNPMSDNGSAILLRLPIEDTESGKEINFTYSWSTTDSSNLSINNSKNPYYFTTSGTVISDDKTTMNQDDKYIAEVHPSSLLGFIIRDGQFKTDNGKIQELYAYCINAGLQTPRGQEFQSNGRVEIHNETEWKEYIKNNTHLGPKNRYTGKEPLIINTDQNMRINADEADEEMFRQLALFFYMQENGLLYANNSTTPNNNFEAATAQGMIYRILDGNFNKKSTDPGYNTDGDEKNLFSTQGDNQGGFSGASSASVDQMQQKMIAKRNEIGIQKIVDSTTIYIYLRPTVKGSTSGKYQSNITGRVEKDTVVEFNFTKVDNNREKLAGAKFILYDSNNNVVDDKNGKVKVSDSNGEFGWVNLTDGNYTIKEIEAPLGYKIINPEIGKFTVEDNKIIYKYLNPEITDINGNIKNNKYNELTSEFSFLKINSKTDTTLTGAQFALKNAGGNIIKTANADPFGLVRFTDISNGTYYLVETRNPSQSGGYTFNDVDRSGINKAFAKITFKDGAYTIDEQSQDFVIENGKTIVYNAPDRYKGSFTINKTKVDEYGTKPFQGVTFTLTQTDGPTQQSQIQKSTDINGKVTFSGLEQNTIWKLTETTPDGFVDYKYEWEVEVGDEDKGTAGVTITPVSDAAKNTNFARLSGTKQSPTLSIVNKKKVIVRVKKVDSETNEPLEGVVLGLYTNKSDDTPIGQATTNASGIATFSDIPIGEDLYVKEIKGLDNYKLELVNMDTDQVEDIRISTILKNNYQNNIAYEILDPVESGISSARPRIYRTMVDIDENQQSIRARVLLTTSSYSEEFSIKDVKTDNFLDFSNASYTVNALTETEYNSLKNKIENNQFTKQFNSKHTASASYSNSIRVDDRDHDGYFVIDVEGIRYNDVKPAFNVKNDYNASFGVHVVAPGSISRNGTSTINIDASFTNTPTVPTITVGNEPGSSKGKLTINKTDGTRGLDGVTFNLSNNSGVSINKTSSSGGKVEFTDLDAGAYTLKETSAPSGYKVSLDTWTVKVGNDGKVSIKKDARNNTSLSTTTYSATNSQLADNYINYNAASNDLNVVTDLTAPAEINNQYNELLNNNISQDTFEYNLKAIADSVDLSKSEFTEIAEPMLGYGGVYNSTRDLANNVYSINTGLNNDRNVNTLLTSAYQASTYASPTNVQNRGLLTSVNGQYYYDGKKIDKFVTFTDAIPPNTNKQTYIIGDTNFKEASRYQRPIIMRNDAGETVFCIDLGVNNPTRTTTKNSRHIEFNSSVINKGYNKQITDADITNLKKIFYYQNEIAREYGLDIVGNEEDKIDLYTAVEANIAYYLYGETRYNEYLNGKTPQSAAVTSDRAKAMAKDLIDKVENAEANGWSIYKMQDWVNITYFYPSDKTQRTVTSHIDNPLEFAKVDENGNMIAGAEFVIKQGNTVVSRWTSNENYTHKVKLEPGTYTLEEVNPPAGYAKMQTLTFAVDATSSTVTEDLDLIQLKYPWDEHKDADKITYTRSTMRLTSGNDFAWLDNTDKALVYLQNNKEVEKPKPSIEFVKTNTRYQSLANVSFELRKANDSQLLQTKTSSNQGRFAFTDLEDGDYEAFETNNPNQGYESNVSTTKPIAKFSVRDGDIQNGVIINDSKKIARTESGSFVITNDYTAPKTDIEFVKVDDTDRNKRLSGGKFDLEKQNASGQYSIVQTTNANWNGRIKFTGLEDGRYRLVESNSPDGYIAPNGGTVATFNVANGRVEKLSYTNNSGYSQSGTNYITNNPDTPSTTDFVIGKVDQYGNTISGVEFTLYNTDKDGNITTVKETKTTDQYGQAQFTNLEVGKFYIVKETSVPAGHEPSNEMVTIRIDADGKVSKFDEVKLGADASLDIANQTNEIKFKKVDAQSGDVLQGFSFELRKDGSATKTTTSDANGLISFSKLDDGSYELFETGVPDKSGYKAPDYALASFDVRNGNITNLIVQGNEINTNIAYIPTRVSQNRLTVTNIKHPEPYTITNIKEPEKPGISFQKVDFDKTDQPIEGVIVRLKDVSRNIYVPINGELNAKTNSEGKLEVGELSDGEYQLTELRPADGYEYEQNLAEFKVVDGKITELKTNGKSATTPTDGTPIKVTNKKKVPRAKFTINKHLNKLGYDQGYNDLFKVEFTLFTRNSDGNLEKYAADGDYDKYPNPRRTNSDGSLTFDELELNKQYYLVETDYNPLYKRMGVVWAIDVDEKGQVTIKPFNIQDPGTIDQDLKDIYKEIPNRILFVKEDNEGNRLDVSHMSDAEILADIARLQSDLDQLGSDRESNEARESIKQEIDSLNNILNNYSQFELYKLNEFENKYYKFEDSDKHRMKFKFDEKDTFKGLFGWHDLPSGTYYVKEVRYPSGYKVDKSNEETPTGLKDDFVAEFTVSGSEQQLKVNSTSVKSYNGSVPKTDDNRYENEILQVTNPDINNDDPTNPILNITNEVLPPVVVTNIPDETPDTNIKLKKVDESNDTGLQGARFKISADLNIINSQENESNNEALIYQDSDDSGYLTFDNLKAGQTYYIKEVAAPTGYILSGQIMKIKFDAEGELIKEESYIVDKDGNKSSENSMYELVEENGTLVLKVKNRKPTYPSTGGSGTFIGFALIGTAVMLAAIAYYGIYANNRNRRRA